jgi:undecaprenyl-diphosphatase
LGLTSDPVSQRFVANVVIAFLPAAVVGVMAHRVIKEVLFSPWVVAVALIVGGILILIIERVRPRPQILHVDQMKLRTALGIGCCQILAMIPGASRAGSTIMGAMMLRVDRAAATQFSFFLAVPAMLGATVYDLYKNRAILTVEGEELIAIGFIVAFVCALFVVRTLVGFVSRHGFGVFAWYRIAIGSVALLLLVMSR